MARRRMKKLPARKRILKDIRTGELWEQRDDVVFLLVVSGSVSAVVSVLVVLALLWFVR